MWFVNLSLAQSWLLLASEIFGMAGLISLLAYITRDTVDSHFDRFTILYVILFLVIVVPTILLIVFKYSPAAFGMVLTCGFMVIWVFLAASGTRYDRYGRVVYGSGNTSVLSKYWRRRQLRMRRREALRHAKSFISPYRSLFGKLVLSNKYCKIIFSTEKNVTKFFCISKEYNSKNELPFFEARAMEKNVWNEEFFNSLCFNFSYNTKLENIRNVFKPEQFLVDDSNFDVSKPKEQPVNNLKPQNKSELQNENPVQQLLEQINVNEATEAELTALPGINIIMAKKIIKQRDYKGEFKSVNDFMKFLKIKPHFEQQLRKLITVKPIEKRSVQKGERILDLDE